MEFQTERQKSTNTGTLPDNTNYSIIRMKKRNSSNLVTSPGKVPLESVPARWLSRSLCVGKHHFVCATSKEGGQITLEFTGAMQQCLVASSTFMHRKCWIFFNRRQSRIIHSVSGADMCDSQFIYGHQVLDKANNGKVDASLILSINL